MFKHQTKIAGLFLLAILMVLLAVNSVGCSQKGMEEPEKVIKIGAAISFTGALSREGKYIKDGYQYWADLVKVKGGLNVGGTKYKVELITYDDKSDAQTSAKLVEKLIVEDQVDFIFGPYGSGICAASSAINERYEKIMITPMSSSPDLYSRGFKYLFGLSAPIAKGFGLHAELMDSLNPKPKTVAIIASDDMFPTAAANVLKGLLEGKGFEVVYFEKYPAGTKEFAPILTELKRLQPDAFVASGYIQDEILLVKQAKELDVNFKYFGTGFGPSVPDYLEILGKDGWFVFSTPYWHKDSGWVDPVNGTTQEFFENFKKAFGREPCQYEAAGAAVGSIFQQAIEKAGSLDNNKIRDALLSLETDTVYQPVKYDATGANVGGIGTILQVQDGKSIMLLPSKIRAGEPIYPVPKWNER